MSGKLIFPRGLQGSGKTTWAMEFVAADPDHRVRLSRDDLRASMHAAVGMNPATERVVSIAQHNAANALLRKGFTVVLDETNLISRHVKEWLKLAERNDAEVEFVDFDVPLEECIFRDMLRGNEAKLGRAVGEKVIRDYYARFLGSHGGKLPPIPTLDRVASITPAPYGGTPGAPRAILCDIDGTLAHMDGRSPYDYSRVSTDTLDETVRNLVEMFAANDYAIIFMSGRDIVCYDQTYEWITDVAEIPEGSFDLFMRPLDDGRQDSVVKAELFDEHVRDHYDVKLVLDDRDQVVEMWRAMGLKVLQVAPGAF